MPEMDSIPEVVMLHPRSSLGSLLAFLFVVRIPAGFAETQCDCVDAYDIASRRAEVTAAIQAYENSIREWSRSTAPTAADEDQRRDFQEREIKPALEKARYLNATPASAVTGPDLIGRCTTENSSPSACMKESTDVHESVHMAQCTALGHRRWSSLEDYAREEIAAYHAELAWLREAYRRLRSECEFELAFDSTIHGYNVVSKSTAGARVSLRLDDSGHFAGNSVLDYRTVDTGPPRRTLGDPLLAALLTTQCKAPPYYTWEGSGMTQISVPRSALMWAQDPRTGNRHVFIELSLHVGETEEVLRFKDRKRCLPPVQEERGAFYSEAFYSDKPGKTIGGTRVVEFNDWYVPGSNGSFAEAELVIKGGAAGLGGPVSAMKSAEETRLVLTRK
jgi:hypothetical protein